MSIWSRARVLARALTVLPWLVRARRAARTTSDLRVLLAAYDRSSHHRSGHRSSVDELRHATDVAVRLVGPRQKECLPRALTLFSLLTRHGYPAEFVSGVRRNGADLTGHAWVEMGGMPVEAPGASHASTGYRELIRIPSRVATGQGDQFLGEMG